MACLKNKAIFASTLDLLSTIFHFPNKNKKKKPTKSTPIIAYKVELNFNDAVEG